ncbi:MAG: alpha/beta hydrolase [Candidatus Hatepunaea meridiana]|nr:alpha/beta hydrolase [Candidatus Hatepunaea meridiana]
MSARILTLLLFLIVIVVSGCEMDGFLFNEKQIDQYSLPGNTIPDSLLEQVTFQSDGYTLYGYLIKSNPQGSGITILYCHGNKYNIDEYWDRVMWLYQLGVNVFIFDYRGFGLSEGESSEEGLFRDGEAAVNFLESVAMTDSLCLYGYSLGNVVSIHLAASTVNPICLISEAPFASANSLTQGSSILDIPARWLTESEFDNAETVKNITTPFLLLHGTDDDFVRYRDNGRIVFENAPEPKSLVIIQGANHDDIPQTLGVDHYLDIIKDWIDESN